MILTVVAVVSHEDSHEKGDSFGRDVAGQILNVKNKHHKK